MSLSEQVARYMSLREPQAEALSVLESISEGLDYRSAQLAAVAEKATGLSRGARPVEFDTEFPSFCFALATGVGKTRLMGACVYHLWKSKGYRNFFILAPGMTIYDKLRAELEPSHPKYMFVGLSDFPAPAVYDGDSYLRFDARPRLFEEKQANVFVFNIGKIFAPKTDRQFKFHRFNENLGAAFSDVLRQMGDLVVLMDESHRYRGEASLKAINDLKPVLGLEFTATPKYQRNVIYSFGLAQAIGRFVKTPTVVTRTNLTTSDKQEMERLKLQDGMTRHEAKKARLAEYCAAGRKELVKPFVLVSTADTEHAGRIRALVESESFCEGRYKGKVIEIHSGKTGAESDENVQRLLEVELPTSTVEVVIHVNMLKEGWDVKNLYTIVPLRASVSDILTEQTIGRGLRLPFGTPTGIQDLDELEIMSHDNYAKLIEAAKGSPLFHFKELPPEDLRPVKTVQVQHGFLDLDKVLDRADALANDIFTGDLPVDERIDTVVDAVVREMAEAHEIRARAHEAGVEPVVTPAQAEMFALPEAPKLGEKFDSEQARAALTKRLTMFFDRAIRVPRIDMEVVTERTLMPFLAKVTRGPFSLVKQHLQTGVLPTGEVRQGEEVEVLAIDNPRGFLAGKLIDAIEELDAPGDKEVALRLVDEYMAGMGASAEDLPRLVHLYRDVIVEDLRGQVEAHLKEHTNSKPVVRSGFIKFRPSTKAVLEKDGIRQFRDDVPRADVPKYAFEGYTKTIYTLVSYDSTPEKDFATALEDDPEVLKWVRPPDGNIPIRAGGSNYNPDFIVETADRKYIVEVKRRSELLPKMDEEVRHKALAATRWCEVASAVPNSKPWEYKLIPDDVILPGRNFAFIISHAVRGW